MRNQLIREKNDPTLADAIKNAASICNIEETTHINTAVHRNEKHSSFNGKFCSFCKKPNHSESECNRKKAQEKASHVFSKEPAAYSKPQQKFHNEAKEFLQQNKQQFQPNTVKKEKWYNYGKLGHKKNECRLHKQNLAIDLSIEDQVNKLFENENQLHYQNTALKFILEETPKQDDSRTVILDEAMKQDDSRTVSLDETKKQEDSRQVIHNRKDNVRQVQFIEGEQEARALVVTIKNHYYYKNKQMHFQNSATGAERTENSLEVENVKSRKLYKIKGFIYHKPVTIVIDMGATGTIMNSDFASRP